MVQVKVEHVIVVLLGLFLLYHFMGSCGCNRVEGWIAMDNDYKHQMPYVQDDKFCGISTEFYNDNRLQYNTDSDDQKSVQTTIDNMKKQIDDNTAEITRKNARITALTSDITSLGKRTDAADVDDWDEDHGDKTREKKLAQDRVTELTAQNAVLNQQMSTAQSNLDASRKKRQDGQDNYLNAQKQMCDKPNRMLKRYGPDYACTGQLELVSGPDSDYWLATATKLARNWTDASKVEHTNACAVYDSGDSYVLNDTTVVATPEFAKGVTGSGGPYHGYKSLVDTNKGRYES